jgi:tRNA-specific adenosine deaminase 1
MATSADGGWEAPPPGAPGPHARSSSWPGLVSACVLEAYDALPRTGKARGDGSEWSALAAVLVSSTSADTTTGLRCVALGTGTKCVGASQRSPQGDVVHDSHAEVVARRAFTCFLHHQLCLAASGEPDAQVIVERQHDGRFALKAGVQVHLYSSHTPCGDCCLGESGESGALGRRTGAKLLGDSPLADGTWREAAGGWQQAGAARRKPGRGEPTLSVSCSDKMARWTVLGLQGACLLHFLAAPVYLASVTVAAETQGNGQVEGALKRSLIHRLEPLHGVLAGSPWSPHPPAVHVAPPPGRRELEVPQCSDNADASERGPSACGASLNWYAGAEGSHGGVEVVTGTTGRKAGATKRTMDGSKTSSRLCRASALGRFRHLLSMTAQKQQQQQQQQKLGGASYGGIKAAAPGGYGAARAALLSSPSSPLFPWIPKPASEQDFV